MNDVLWGTFAIQSAHSGKNLRPFQARKDDGTDIVLYNAWRWKCMTWQFIHMGSDSYRLINRYTGKTFQVVSDPQPGMHLSQQIPGSSSGQEWNFIQQRDGTWKVRLKGSDLYLTISSPINNSPVVLLPKSDSVDQRWRLREQDPWF